MKQKLKITFVVLGIFLVLFAVGCAKSVMEKGQVMTSSAKTFPMPVPEMAVEVAEFDEVMAEPAIYRHYDGGHYGSGEDIEIEPKIIRTANMNIEVEDFFIGSQKVEAYATKYGGYVSNSHANVNDKDRQSGTITIRVPDIHFDAVLAELTLIGEIKSKHVSGSDVTEQFVDLEARIKNSEAHEERLLKMYENATNVDEMMQIERELSRVREQIERWEGRLRYLSKSVDFSTVTVHLYEPIPVVKEWGVWKSIKDAFNHALASIRFIIELLGILLPFIVVGIIIALIVKWRKGKHKIRRK